jgi:TRAP-type C4-dicarboxylate transport system permease small subunit
MRKTPRFFSSRLDRVERRVYRAAVVFFLGVFCAVVWPIYPRFAGAEPRLLGIPLSFFYVIVFILLSFVALLLLFVWEGNRRDPDESGTDLEG